VYVWLAVEHVVMVVRVHTRDGLVTVEWQVVAGVLLRTRDSLRMG
jgi:hypothetical protein